MSVNHTEQRLNILISRRIATKRNHLIEGRQSIAHTPFPLTGDQRERPVTDLDLFCINDLTQPLGDLAQADLAKIETLTTRQNSHRNLVRFGCSKNEFYMFGGFFESLQQGVKGVDRKHMDFIDDKNFVAGV